MRTAMGRVMAAALVLAAGGVAGAGTWTPLVRTPPSGVNLMMLMSDGTVMCAANNGSTIGNAWYRLTPDSTGSYVNGTWTTRASMADTRLYYSAQVLRDGRLFVAGGEYGTGFAKAEVYNPVTNLWAAAPVPTTVLDPSVASPVTGLAQQFYDSNSEILPNGNVIITPVCPQYAGQTVIYNPSTNSFSNGPNLFRGSYQDEATWVKLPDNTILTIDPFGSNTERYNPASNTWINDGVVGQVLYDSFGHEMGPALLLPNGKAFFVGANGHTALYTPTGTTAPGTWVNGPDLPAATGVPDGPGAALVNGNVLLAVSPVPTSTNHFPSPTTFYEYNPTTNAYTAQPAPVGGSDPIPTYQAVMLTLPDGKVLYSHMSTSLYVYTPTGSPIAAGKPTVLTVTPNGDGSYHLTGRLLNGISEGASYGDDQQMNSNYPIVRLTSSGGTVFFARTFNWNSTGVATGATITTTEFTPPAGLPAGTYTLAVIANGFASDPSCFTAPTITASPLANSACPGVAATMSVTNGGIGPFVYTWQVHASATPAAPWVSLSTVPAALPCGGTARVTAAAASTGVVISGCSGNYQVRCLVSNNCGTATSGEAVLTVLSASGPPCGPSCDPDLNNDGNVDQDDVLYLINVVGGGGNPAGIDPDFNHDGNIDQDDITALINVVAGGPCP